MLGKLLKYEMQAMGRILMPLYGVLLVLSVAFGLSLRQSTGAPAQMLSIPHQDR